MLFYILLFKKDIFNLLKCLKNAWKMFDKARLFGFKLYIFLHFK